MQAGSKVISQDPEVLNRLGPVNPKPGNLFNRCHTVIVG